MHLRKEFDSGIGQTCSVEVISTEDLLHNVGNHDDEVKEIRMKNKMKILKKLKCRRMKRKENSKIIVREILEEVVGALMVKPNSFLEPELELSAAIYFGAGAGLIIA